MQDLIILSCTAVCKTLQG